MNWRERVTIDPAICHGKACIAGTRMMVSVILDNLAADVSVADIIQSHPSLKAKDVHAAVSYAAELARGRVIAVP